MYIHVHVIIYVHVTAYTYQANGRLHVMCRSVHVRVYTCKSLRFLDMYIQCIFLLPLKPRLRYGILMHPFSQLIFQSRTMATYPPYIVCLMYNVSIQLYPYGYCLIELDL